MTSSKSIMKDLNQELYIWEFQVYQNKKHQWVQFSDNFNEILEQNQAKYKLIDHNDQQNNQNLVFKHENYTYNFTPKEYFRQHIKNRHVQKIRRLKVELNSSQEQSSDFCNIKLTKSISVNQLQNHQENENKNNKIDQLTQKNVREQQQNTENQNVKPNLPNTNLEYLMNQDQENWFPIQSPKFQNQDKKLNDILINQPKTPQQTQRISRIDFEEDSRKQNPVSKSANIPRNQFSINAIPKVQDVFNSYRQQVTSYSSLIKADKDQYKIVTKTNQSVQTNPQGRYGGSKDGTQSSTELLGDIESLLQKIESLEKDKKKLNRMNTQQQQQIEKISTELNDNIFQMNKQKKELSKDIIKHNSIIQKQEEVIKQQKLKSEEFERINQKQQSVVDHINEENERLTQEIATLQQKIEENSLKHQEAQSELQKESTKLLNSQSKMYENEILREQQQFQMLLNEFKQRYESRIKYLENQLKLTQEYETDKAKYCHKSLQQKSLELQLNQDQPQKAQQRANQIHTYCDSMLNHISLQIFADQFSDIFKQGWKIHSQTSQEDLLSQPYESVICVCGGKQSGKSLIIKNLIDRLSEDNKEEKQKQLEDFTQIPEFKDSIKIKQKKASFYITQQKILYIELDLNIYDIEQQQEVNIQQKQIEDIYFIEMCMSLSNQIIYIANKSDIQEQKVIQFIIQKAQHSKLYHKEKNSEINQNGSQKNKMNLHILFNIAYLFTIEQIEQYQQCDLALFQQLFNTQFTQFSQSSLNSNGLEKINTQLVKLELNTYELEYNYQKIQMSILPFYGLTQIFQRRFDSFNSFLGKKLLQMKQQIGKSMTNLKSDLQTYISSIPPQYPLISKQKDSTNFRLIEKNLNGEIIFQLADNNNKNNVKESKAIYLQYKCLSAEGNEELNNENYELGMLKTLEASYGQIISLFQENNQKVYLFSSDLEKLILLQLNDDYRQTLECSMIGESVLVLNYNDNTQEFIKLKLLEKQGYSISEVVQVGQFIEISFSVQQGQEYQND